MLDSEAQVVAVGINCTAPRLIAPLVRQLRRVTSKPIVVYPNSGQTWDSIARQWRGTTADDTATLVPEWRLEGARWFGGCCGTTPDDIANLRAVIAA
jgi:homocysteine S-methyltransferase